MTQAEGAPAEGAHARVEQETVEPLLREWGCSYRGLGWFSLLFVIGVGFDMIIGAAGAHAIGWASAAFIVLGLDLLVIRATRANKTLEVTDAEIRIGDEAIPREQVVTATEGLDPTLPVLGWEGGMPRKRPGVIVGIDDGRSVVVPTRDPDALLAVLGLDAAEDELDLAVRPAEDDDLPLLAEIDERADTVFRVAGYDLPDVGFDDDVASAALVLVAGRPAVGFARVNEVDGAAHLSEVGVLPAWMRRGLGDALLDAACAWARGAGHDAITLTTYADVPWNGPMYARRGWAELADAELTPGLRAIREQEAEWGLDDVGRRIAMRRPL